MDSKQLQILKVENQNEFDSLYLSDQPLGVIEQQSTFIDSLDHWCSSFLDIDSYILPTQNNHNIFHLGYTDFEDINHNLCYWDINFPSFYEENVFDANPLNTITQNTDQLNNFTSISNEFPSSAIHQKEFKCESSENEEIKRQSTVRSSKYEALELSEIQKYFCFPITKAAKELKVGVTVLKKRCRELNIKRWPHRKIKSLKSLIDNAKEMGLTNHEIQMLEDEHKIMVETLPELELTERTKKLRQACFKANYKKKRLLSSFV